MNGGLTSIRAASRRNVPIRPYASDPRWSTPARPRNDVFVVDISDRYVDRSSASDEDPLLLTA
jgi:hypothetical protein